MSDKLNWGVYIMRLLVAILLGAFVLFPAVSEVKAEANLRVAFVDIQKALSESKTGSKAQKGYEKEVKKAQKDLESQKKEFQRLKEQYTKQQASLSSNARAEKQEALLKKEKELKRSFEDTQEKLRRKNATIVNDLVKSIRKVVADVGKEEGFTVILERSAQSVLYADNSIDITEKVVKKFDASK